MRGHPLLVGIRSSKRLELPDELRVATERELGVDPLDLGGQPQLAQARERVALRPLEDDVCQRRPPPEGECLRTQLDRLLELARAGFVDQPFELLDVEAAGFDPKLVTGRARHDDAGAKCLAQGMHVALHELLRRWRRAFAPKLVD